MLFTLKLATKTLSASIPSALAARRSFSTTLYTLSEGAPSGKSQDAFSKREKTEEERFIRKNELEKMEALKKTIEKNQKMLKELEKDHHEQDNKGSDKKH